jgi:hypothetical protein
LQILQAVLSGNLYGALQGVGAIPQDDSCDFGPCDTNSYPGAMGLKPAQCVQNFYATGTGQLVQFFSPISLLPSWNPNARANWGSWTETIFGKGGGTLAITSGEEISSITTGTTTVIASWTEGLTATALKIGGKVSLILPAGMALNDLMAHAGCNLDPNSSGEGIPVAPK